MCSPTHVGSHTNTATCSWTSSYGEDEGKVANANQAGHNNSHSKPVNALEMQLHHLGLTAEVHTDPKPPVSREFSLGSREESGAKGEDKPA